MEGDCMDIGSSGATLASSRWNPTKEQINMLESLYRQGIRTPSAEQIQQITSRLRAYGHIEGKNVFYWFQNHKARQRQKQKQERMAFFNRYMHKAQPVFPPCTNVLCGPYYLPRSDIGFYPQCTKVLLPGGSKRRAKVEDQMENPDQHHDYNIVMEMNNNNESGMIDNNQETLALFPLHPTGILQGRTHSTCVDNSVTPASSSETNTGLEDGSCDQTFFDFFSGRGCESN